MKTEKTIGILFIVGAIGVLVAYTFLTIIFDYPNILRQETGIILIKFHEGGNRLVWTWWAFAILGLPLFRSCCFNWTKIRNEILFYPLGNYSRHYWSIHTNDWLIALDFCSTRFSQQFCYRKRNDKRSQQSRFSSCSSIRWCRFRGTYWAIIYHCLDNNDDIGFCPNPTFP